MTDIDSVKSISKLFVLLLILFLTIGATLQVLHLELGLLSTQLLLVLLPAYLFLRRHNKLNLEFTRLKMFDSGHLPAIIITMASALVLVLAFGIGLSAIFETIGWYFPEEIVPPPETLNQLLLYYLLIAMLPGICEEFLFRGTIMPFLEPHGLLPALVFSSLLFGLFHLSFVRLPGTFFLGLIIALIVIKTGSLLAGMFAHTLNNAAAVTIMYFTATGDYSEAAPVWLILALLPFAIIGLFYGLRKLGGSQDFTATQRKILPQGWLNIATVVSLILFLLVSALEVVIYSGLLERILEVSRTYFLAL